jgi:selenocysteine-specific translation elongation factor
MKNLTIGIFHDAELGKQLGKKGTKSDINLYNRKTDDAIYSFLEPVDDKFSVKTQIISEIDVAIISFGQLTKQTGETIVLLDSFKVSKGLIITNPYEDTEKIKSIIKDTVLQSYQIIEKDPIEIFEKLQEFNIKKNSDIDPIVIIDHAFSVKGVGEVFLGVVKQGTINKHDSLYLMPQKKNVIIRSIQMQDKDVNTAEAGSRVGCAIKGANAEEMKRGSVLCSESAVQIDSKLKVSFEKNPFYNELKDGIYHISIGLQTVPAAIKKINEKELLLELEKEIVYTFDDIFLLLDLNAKKSRIIGTAKIKY